MVTEFEMELIECLIDEIKNSDNPSEKTLHLLVLHMDIDIVSKFFDEFTGEDN